jgi:hypothetical protein
VAGRYVVACHRPERRTNTHQVESQNIAEPDLVIVLRATEAYFMLWAHTEYGKSKPHSFPRSKAQVDVLQVRNSEVPWWAVHDRDGFQQNQGIEGLTGPDIKLRI